MPKRIIKIRKRTIEDSSSKCLKWLSSQGNQKEVDKYCFLKENTRSLRPSPCQNCEDKIRCELQNRN